MIWDRALLTAAVTVALFLVTSVIAWYRNRYERRNLIRALYSEIDFNTRDLEFFRTGSADIELIRQHLDTNPDGTPHITDAHHTAIYSANLNRLHHLSDDLIAKVVLFYGLLGKLKAQIDGVGQMSFQRISLDGKILTIERIQSTALEGRDIGLQVLEAL
ncbi:hypothetical protein AB1M95_10385 [Sulfitobacter sp. LCG007]